MPTSCEGTCQYPMRLHFKNIVWQNERIGTLGGGCALAAPLDPPVNHWIYWGGADEILDWILDVENCLFEFNF